MRLLTTCAAMLLTATTTAAAPIETRDDNPAFPWSVSFARWNMEGQTCGKFKMFYGPDIETETIKTDFPRGFCYTWPDAEPFTAFAYVFKMAYYTGPTRAEGTGPCTITTYADSECQDPLNSVLNAELYSNMGQCMEGGEPASSISVQCEPEM